MYIAYLTGEYPRATDTFIQREVTALRQLGIEVDTFSIRRTSSDHAVGLEQEREYRNTYYVLSSGIRMIVKANIVTLLRSPRRYCSTWWMALTVRSPGIRALVYQLFYFAEAALVAYEIRRRGIVHLHNHFAGSSCTVAMLAAQLGGFTFSFTMHGPAIFFEPERWNIDRKIDEALFVVCISHFCRSQAMIWTPYSKWDRLHIVHCGIDPNRFSPVKHHGSGKRLLYVGRLDYLKGLPVLLEAVAKIRCAKHDVELRLVGDGPQKPELQQMARRLGIEDCVKFLGYQSQEQVCQHLSETDVFILSSFAEGVPVVLMEAMASAVPVISTQVAGVSELMTDGCHGYLVPPGDVETLSRRVVDLLDDGRLRNRMGQSGREKVLCDFNIHKEAEWLCRIFRESVGSENTSIRRGTGRD